MPCDNEKKKKKRLKIKKGDAVIVEFTIENGDTVDFCDDALFMHGGFNDSLDEWQEVMENDSIFDEFLSEKILNCMNRWAEIYFTFIDKRLGLWGCWSDMARYDREVVEGMHELDNVVKWVQVKFHEEFPELREYGLTFVPSPVYRRSARTGTQMWTLSGRIELYYRAGIKPVDRQSLPNHIDCRQI